MSPESLRFPFLGAREDGEPFEYLLMEITPEKATIAIFRWMVNHINLDEGEKVHLFVPAVLTTQFLLRKDAPGKVEAIKKSEEEQGFFYEILFLKPGRLNVSVKGTGELIDNATADEPLANLLIQLVKDSLILKQGISVYLKHIAPYFSRLVDTAHKDYLALEDYIFNDIKNKVKKNEMILKELYESLKTIQNTHQIPILINLEELRQSVESEIGLDLFLVAFSNTETRDELMQMLKESKYEDKLRLKYFYMNYLIAIKDLEKRLYSNYNQIVLIYLKSLAEV